MSSTRSSTARGRVAKRASRARHRETSISSSSGDPTGAGSRLCREASEELGFEVDPTVLSASDWESDATGFIRSLKEQPLIPIARVDGRG